MKKSGKTHRHQHDAHVDAFRVEEAAAAERRGSVVAGKYKAKYAARAAEKKRPKVLARGCGDWLHQTLAKQTLTEDGSLDVEKMDEILDANGITKHRNWNRSTRGWQGRLRMSGRLALEPIVAEQGELKVTPKGDAIPAPKTWINAHLR